MKKIIALVIFMVLISGCSKEKGVNENVQHVTSYDNLKLSTSISHENHLSGYSWISNNNHQVDIGSKMAIRKATVYGADCAGCYSATSNSASTSAQILLSTTQVRQSDGTWKDGITYDGYYIVAMDSAIPLCTTIEITNHGYVGNGIIENEPFKAIVLDRGRLISANAMDLFSGSEENSSVKVLENTNVNVEILGFNELKDNSNNEKYCEIK